MIAEYNPERTQANQIMHDLANGRGLGTFAVQQRAQFELDPWGPRSENSDHARPHRCAPKSADTAPF